MPWFGIFAVLLLVTDAAQAQYPFVHSNDVLFSIQTDHKGSNIGDQIVVHYTVKNASNGPLYVPRSQWEVKCGNPPHLWSWLEDSSGKHYEPGYAFSCLGPNPADQMSISERMGKDALLLKPGQKVTGSFSFDSKIFVNQLKPGTYRLEAILYGWNLPFDAIQLSELAGMGAPFLIGENHASSEVKLHHTGQGTPRGVVGDVPGGLPPDDTTAVGGISSSEPQSSPDASRARVRVAGKVMRAFLVTNVNPSYPSEAEKQHVDGTVLLHINIDENGNVSKVELVSGHPLLVPTAIEAVKQWKYRPYLLNQKPVEVETMVLIKFVIEGNAHSVIAFASSNSRGW